MREEVMSIGLLGSPDSVSGVEREEVRAAVQPQVQREVRSVRQPVAWSPEDFARQQIHGLVRQVFFSTAARPVRQVVFSSVEPQTDVRSICRRVGEALARETLGSVAVLGGAAQVLQYAGRISERVTRDGVMPLQRIATRIRGNLWLVPSARTDAVSGTTASLHSYLGELRREFEYSIVEGPPAGKSNEATAMAQFADGIILVLSAQRTRRVTARKVKEALEGAQARILGTVLGDRVFPIPEAIYRRL